MRAIFEIEEISSTDGLVSYHAWLASDLGSDGIPDPSCPMGRGETAWEALAALIAEISWDTDPALVLYAGEESLD